jgi:hypothetical protein
LCRPGWILDRSVPILEIAFVVSAAALVAVAAMVVRSSEASFEGGSDRSVEDE